jgi:hypothetical protein
MLVYYGNEIYELEMTYLLFSHLREKHPNDEVEISILTTSTYKTSIKAKIGELNDYSIVRNNNALGRY